jgi:hypothetical protein
MNKHGAGRPSGLCGQGKDAASYHVLSFLLGAALPTALLFYLASDRLGEGLSSISPSSWGSSRTPTTQQLAGATDHTAPTSPTSQGQEVRTTYALASYIDCTVLFHARCMTLSRPSQSEFAELAELLPRVATDDDRTVILTSVNEAFARPNSLLGLFRESFRAGEGTEHLLDHVLVVAVDAMAFVHCKAVHPHCYRLEVDSATYLSSESSFLSAAYVELVWAKLSLQQRVLELGYNF